MPVGGLFVGVGGAQHGQFVKGLSRQLQADGQSCI